MFELLTVPVLPNQELAAAKKIVVSIDIVRPAVGEPRIFGWAECHFERVDDPARDVVLDFEDVRQVPVVALGPEVPACYSVDELAGNPDPITCLTHTAFEHVAHAEVAAYLLRVDRLALVGKGRVARDHHQTGDLRQVGDNFFADAI